MQERDCGPLISIGRFARLGGVSIKALRLYASLGLLEPAAIAPHSGYRRYAIAQLAELHRILMLKSAGLTLADIAANLWQRDAASLESIRDSLLERAEEVRRQLQCVNAELAARASGDDAPKILVKRVPKVMVLAVRQRIDCYDRADVLLHDLAKRVGRADRLVAGAIWHGCGARGQAIDCEAFWILNSSARAAAKALAPATVASVLHQGGDATVGASYEAARRWIADNHYRIAGPNREIYLGELTEIQFPIERRN